MQLKVYGFSRVEVDLRQYRTVDAGCRATPGNALIIAHFCFRGLAVVIFGPEETEETLDIESIVSIDVAHEALLEEDESEDIVEDRLRSQL